MTWPSINYTLNFPCATGFYINHATLHIFPIVHISHLMPSYVKCQIDWPFQSFIAWLGYFRRELTGHVESQGSADGDALVVVNGLTRVDSVEVVLVEAIHAEVVHGLTVHRLVAVVN